MSSIKNSKKKSAAESSKEKKEGGRIETSQKEEGYLGRSEGKEITDKKGMLQVHP